MTNREVNIVLKATDKATAELKKASSQVSKFWKTMDNTASDVKKNSNSIVSWFKGIGAAVAVGFAVTAIWKRWKELYNTATELEALGRKSDIVLWDFKAWVEEVANEVANSMWLTRNQFVWAASDIADILVPLQFSREEAARMSTELVTLSWALAEWSKWQYTATQMSEILQKAMVGEVEQLKTVGIVIDQSSKQYNERIKQIIETTGATKEQARALDIQRQIMEKSTDAQTAFTEWGGTLARQQAESTARMQEMKDMLAEALWPAFAEITKKVSDMIIKVTENEKVMKALTAIIQYLGDVIIATIWFIGLFIEGIGNLIDWTSQFIEYVGTNFGKVRDTMRDVMQQAWDYVMGVFQDVKDFVWGVVDWLTDKVQKVINFVNKIKSAVSSVGWWSVTGQRALGWPVQAWQTYLVWENWPELFTPATSGKINNNVNNNSNAININLWNVTVANGRDEKYLVNLIQDTLSKWQRNLQLGIA